MSDICIHEPETERLRLRQWQDDDLVQFRAMGADPRVMEFFPALLDSAASDALAERCRSLIAQRGWGFWAIELRSTGEFIGFTGLHVPRADLPCSPCVEIGWRLAADHWGQGYATEAARAALRVGFAELGLDEIVSFMAVQNQRSQSVMRRLGMQPDPLGFDHPAVAAGHPLRPHVLFRLRRQSWWEATRGTA
jgi:RimJ/RimL family protein N-acetyltransferase